MPTKHYVRTTGLDGGSGHNGSTPALAWLTLPMRPSLACDDALHDGLRRPELGRDLALGNTGPVQAPHLVHLHPCEARPRVVLSSRATLRMRARPVTASLLRGHVGRVLAVRPDMQMVGPDARGLVAGMHRDLPDWERLAVRDLPRDTMRRFVSLATPEAAVATRVPVARPEPASGPVALVNLRPESLLEGREALANEVRRGADVGA